MSGNVLCCSAKSWARVLGWMHIVSGAVGLLVFSVTLIPFLAAIDSRGDGSQEEFEDAKSVRLAATATSLSIIVIGNCLLALVGGILLVKGVSEENPSKLQCWLIIEWIRIVFTTVTVMLNLGPGDFGAVASDLISILSSFFCFWVVSLHRRELLSAGRTGSVFGSLSASQNMHQLLREEGVDDLVRPSLLNNCL